MKRFLALLLVLQPLICFSQILTPTKWDISLSKEEVKIGETVDIIFTVAIDEGWYFYAVGEHPPHASFSFEENASYTLVGKMKEGAGVKEKDDEALEEHVRYFEKKAEFRQTIKVLKVNPLLKIELEGQVCSNTSKQCIRVAKKFTIDNIDVIPSTAVKDKDSSRTEKIVPVKKDDKKILVSNKDSVPALDTARSSSTPPGVPGKFIEKIEEKDSETSLLGFILLAIGLGFLSLLTPCVFPMVPLTVTFFTTTSTSRGQAIRKAIIYGVSIVAIYTLIGLFTGPVLASVLSTHWIPNSLFFLIFIVFGLSFLGLFEITIPSSFINKVDAQSEKGGMFGVFFMAFTLVLVSFSCTVPIVGYVLVESSGGIALKPTLGMLAYSTAFAIPFTIFAMFPEWLKKLPKSGGWLNVIKVVLGFLEIALAFKFLSMVDQVYHLNILDREIYLAIWIVVFGLMGFYLLGKISMPHDSEIKHISVPRLIFAMIPLIFVVYLIPGMFGAPLKALSGYLPPMNTHDFDIPKIIREYSDNHNDNSNLCGEPMFSKQLNLPHGLKAYFTYEEALKCAKEKKMPLFIDFTGHACTNCREIEANVWSDPDVLKILKNDYIIVSLYVDDRTPLPKELWYESKVDGDLKKTLGDKNADFQISKFDNNAQPYYFLIDPFTEEKLVSSPLAYEPSVMTYLEYLNKGLTKFKSLHP